jgi:hypothetical protein
MHDRRTCDTWAPQATTCPHTNGTAQNTTASFEQQQDSDLQDATAPTEPKLCCPYRWTMLLFRCHALEVLLDRKIGQRQNRTKEIIPTEIIHHRKSYLQDTAASTKPKPRQLVPKATDPLIPARGTAARRKNNTSYAQYV